MNRTKITYTHNILAVTPNGNERLALNYWVQTIYPAPPTAAVALVQHWTFRWFVSACKHHSSPAASCAAILGEQCEAQDWTPAHIQSSHSGWAMRGTGLDTCKHTVHPLWVSNARHGIGHLHTYSPAILGEQCEEQDWTPAHIHFMSISQSSQTG